jgi:hypothetical protein
MHHYLWRIHNRLGTALAGTHLEAPQIRLALTLGCEHDVAALRIVLIEAQAAGYDLLFVAGVSLT